MLRLVVLQARVQWRYGIVALVAALTLAWSGLLLALPAAVAHALTPWLLMLETAVLGTTVVGALVILERDLGLRAAYAVTPVRPGARLAATVGVLTALVLVSAVPVALAGQPTSLSGFAATLAGVGLTALLTMLVASAVAADRQSVLTFMMVLPLTLAPLVLAPLLHAVGLGHWLLYLVPTTGAMDLVRAGYGDAAAGLGWSAAWLSAACVAAAWLAARQFRRGVPGHRHRPARPRRTVTARSHRGAVRSFLRTDLARLRRDPLLILLLVSPLLLGLGVRYGYPPASGWLATRHGFDLDPYLPVLLAVVVVLHVPVAFGMIGALMVLDDSDSRALTALRVSPLTLGRYLGYRAGLVSLAAVVGLAVAVPSSRLAPASALPRLLPAVLLAVLLAPLVMMGALALAGNKVEGVAALKLLGVPVYLPVAAWWVDGPAGWLLAPLPSWWVVQALWRSPTFAVAGAVVSLAVLLALTSRARSRRSCIRALHVSA
jgi:fluoroquinolone transport system permease protein